MATISATISEENADLLRIYSVKTKRSLKKQSEVINEALTEFFENKLGEQGNCKAPCIA